MVSIRQRVDCAARHIENLPLWASCFIIFVLSFGLRASLIVWLRTYQSFEFPEPVKIAQSLAETGLFGNPYKVPTGATAHTAPFVPFLLSLVYRYYGAGAQTELVQEFLSTAACSLQYALLPLCAVYLGWSPRIGTVGGLFGALIPFRFWLETKGTFEHVYAALALLLLTMMTAKAWRSGRFSTSSAIWRGAAWALAFHISASLLPICLALLLIETVVIRPEKLPRQAPYLATLGLTILILLAPWTARNYYHFRKLFFIRNNLGLALAVSNNSDAKPLFVENLASYRHPHGSTAEALKVRQMGEMAYDRKRMQEAFAWIRTHPAAFLKLTLQRIFYFWFPTMQRIWQAAIYAVLTVLGLVGAWMAFRRKQVAAWLVLSIWLTFPAVYYLIESFARYRYPLDWTFLLLASYCVHIWLMGAASLRQDQTFRS